MRFIALLAPLRDNYALGEMALLVGNHSFVGGISIRSVRVSFKVAGFRIRMRCVGFRATRSTQKRPQKYS